VLGSAVIFHDAWVPYAERAAWLAQAACGLACARDQLETRFAFRTRLLDCMWAGLPIVCTSGDELASRVANDDLGGVAAPGDATALADALERVLDRGRAAFAPRLATAAAEYAWPRAARPLVDWVRTPERGPRLGTSPAALRPPAAQRARELAYLVGRPFLVRLRP
jgi:glycosyltransferase involved in cell wall biosynthesis